MSFVLFYMCPWTSDNCSIHANYQHFNKHIQRSLNANLLTTLFVPLGILSLVTSITGDTNTPTSAHSFHITHIFFCHRTFLPCLSVDSLRKPPVYKAVSQHLLCSRLPEGLASAGPIITVLYLTGSFWAEWPTGEQARGEESRVQF